jgi:hypothetical protein
MSVTHTPNAPRQRERTTSRLRWLSRGVVVAATGATVAIGVVVAHEHSGARGANTAGTNGSTGSGSVTTTTPGSSASTNTGSSSGTSSGVSSAPSTSNATPSVTSGGTSR